MAALEELGLESAHLQALEQADIQDIKALANLSYADLADQTGLEESSVQSTFAKLDFFLDRHYQSQVLCPSLPPCAYSVECQYLELADRLLTLLAEQDILYLDELAFEKRSDLKVQGIGPLDILELEFALSSFVDGYRKGDIVLEIEEEVMEPAPSPATLAQPELDPHLPTKIQALTLDEDFELGPEHSLAPEENIEIKTLD